MVQLKSEHPDAKIVVHPECTPDVIALADHVASTTGIIKYPGSNHTKEFIVGTEIGILHRLRQTYPDKTFLPATPYPIALT